MKFPMEVLMLGVASGAWGYFLDLSSLLTILLGLSMLLAMNVGRWLNDDDAG